MAHILLLKYVQLLNVLPSHLLVEIESPYCCSYCKVKGFIRHPTIRKSKKYGIRNNIPKTRDSSIDKYLHVYLSQQHQLEEL
jgi:hypothetical protein